MKEHKLNMDEFQKSMALFFQLSKTETDYYKNNLKVEKSFSVMKLTTHFIFCANFSMFAIHYLTTLNPQIAFVVSFIPAFFIAFIYSSFSKKVFYKNKKDLKSAYDIEIKNQKLKIEQDLRHYNSYINELDDHDKKEFYNFLNYLNLSKLHYSDPRNRKFLENIFTKYTNLF